MGDQRCPSGSGLSQEAEQLPSYSEAAYAESRAAIAFKKAADGLWHGQSDVEIEQLLPLKALIDKWIKAVSDKQEVVSRIRLGEG